MIAIVKNELLSKIQNSDDEILLKQISLLLDGNQVMKLNKHEKNAIDEAVEAVKNNQFSSDEEFQKEWDKWVG
ncbi:MAG: hypothetical protein R2739_03235 [Chitinophagales bacterium]|nr:hypothetical protein [Bacteroidota bacterium]